MKLKELFDKYTFDDIVPFLKEIITDNPDSLPDFRMAFDELRMMKPSDENSEDILIKDFLDKMVTYWLILYVGILVTHGTNALPNMW